MINEDLMPKSDQIIYSFIDDFKPTNESNNAYDEMDKFLQQYLDKEALEKAEDLILKYAVASNLDMARYAFRTGVQIAR